MGVTDFLQGKDIRPEGVNITLPCLSQHLAEGQAGVQQQCLLILKLVVMSRIVIAAENVEGHGDDIQTGFLIRYRSPGGQLCKTKAVHVFFNHAGTFLGAGQRKQRLVLVRSKNAVQILHDHCEARIIISFLLRQHKCQCF